MVLGILQNFWPNCVKKDLVIPQISRWKPPRHKVYYNGLYGPLVDSFAFQFCIYYRAVHQCFILEIPQNFGRRCVAKIPTNVVLRPQQCIFTYPAYRRMSTQAERCYLIISTNVVCRRYLSPTYLHIQYRRISTLPEQWSMYKSSNVEYPRYLDNAHLHTSYVVSQRYSAHPIQRLYTTFFHRECVGMFSSRRYMISATNSLINPAIGAEEESRQRRLWTC